MILNKVKKSKSGAALIVCLVIILFLSLLGTMNMNATHSELKIAGNMNAKNLRFQAAEAGLDYTIVSKFYTDDLDEMLSLEPKKISKYCISNGAIYDSNQCKGKYLNSDKSLTAESTVELNNEKECFAYGSSDQKASCFIIKGEGDIPVLNQDSEIHVQELQVNTANVGNNGIYEL